MPESLRRQGLEVVAVPYRPVSDDVQSDSISGPGVKRSIYLTKIRGTQIELFCSTSGETGKTRIFARLASDGSIPPGDISQSIDLAMVRIGATVQSVERPLTYALRNMKSEAKELFDVWIRGKTRSNLPPEPDIETIEAAIRNRDEMRNRYRSHERLFFAIFVFGIFLIVLVSEFESFGFLLLPYVAMGFPTMFYLFVRDFIDKNRFLDWPCPRCGKRFMPYASYGFTHTRCRYCGWEIPNQLR